MAVVSGGSALATSWSLAAYAAGAHEVSGSKVINGVAVASQSRASFMAQIVSCGSLGGCSLCGGTLISQDVVLTAAHCISSEGSAARLPGLTATVTLGCLAPGAAGASTCERLGVRAFVAHPAFAVDPVALVPSADLALLFLATASSAGTPIPLDAFNTSGIAFGNATVMGWGAQLRAGGPTAATLQYATLGPVPQDVCARVMSDVTPDKICASGPLGASGLLTDTCTGDSGGPLLLQPRDGAADFAVASLATSAYNLLAGTPLEPATGPQLAVTSYGPALCGGVGQAGGYGVYTRTYPYLPWIDAAICAAGGAPRLSAPQVAPQLVGGPALQPSSSCTTPRVVQTPSAASVKSSAALARPSRRVAVVLFAVWLGTSHAHRWA